MFWITVVSVVVIICIMGVAFVTFDMLLDELALKNYEDAAFNAVLILVFVFLLYHIVDILMTEWMISILTNNNGSM